MVNINTNIVNIENFNKLDSTVQISFIIAMHIRNEMENFHSQYLSDEQMRKLNPIIRQATYDILKYLKHASREDNSDKKIVAQDVINVFKDALYVGWSKVHDFQDCRLEKYKMYQSVR